MLTKLDQVWPFPRSTRQLRDPLLLYGRCNLKRCLDRFRTLPEAPRYNMLAVGSDREPGSCQTPFGVLPTLSWPVCRASGAGRRPHRSPDPPDCARPQAVAGSIRPPATRPPGECARPSGTASVRRASPATASRGKQRGRLASRPGILSGQFSEHKRIPVRRAVFLRRLEFTAIALAGVPLGMVHTIATRKRNSSGTILSQHFPSSL